VRVARPSPVPSSGFLPLSTDLAALAARANPLRDPPFAVAPRRFAALFHAARIPGVALQSFPFSRSRTRSRGPGASLRVRVRPPNGAARPEGFATPFPGAPTFSPRRARGSPDCEGRDDGSLESLGAARLRVATRVCDVSSRIGRARRTRRPARPLRSFAPLESPFLLPTACPGQGAVDRPLLSWAFFPSRACSSSPWVRCARGRSSTGQARSHRVLESPAPGHAYSPGPNSGRGV